MFELKTCIQDVCHLSIYEEKSGDVFGNNHWVEAFTKKKKKITG